MRVKYVLLPVFDCINHLIFVLLIMPQATELITLSHLLQAKISLIIDGHKG